MKKILLVIVAFALLIPLTGCQGTTNEIQVAATTAPVYAFTSRICQGTDICVGQVITENISCLHDYTLQTSQMRFIENAEILIISGAGLESFLDDALTGKNNVIDASSGVDLLCHDHGHDSSDHHHESDPHIWLSPQNAKIMAQNICNGLTAVYPHHANAFTANLTSLLDEITTLSEYAAQQLQHLTCKHLITFHDGFGYMADAFGLEILRAIEEESGSEASAATLIELCDLVTEYSLPAVFIEQNGSSSAAQIIASETGIRTYTLDMAMSNSNYFQAMYHNIDTLKEALE